MHRYFYKCEALVNNIKEAHRLLYYDNKNDMAIHQDEKFFLSKLLGENFCIGYSIGVIENGKVKILQGALIGMDKNIRKVDRHAREAIVEITVAGKNKLIAVALEIVDKN